MADALHFVAIDRPAGEFAAVVLGSVALDITGSIRAIAKKRRTEIDAIEVLVHGKLHNPMVFLRVVGEQGDAGISIIEARVYISSLEEDDAVKQVWTDMLATAPVVNTLRKSVDLKLTYQQVL